MTFILRTRIWTALLLLFTRALANTEKTIFLGPEAATIPLAHAKPLSELGLDTLTPANGTLRTQLAALFPSPEYPHGTATWLILDKLTPHQRYEVRVCWPATQPTAFSLTTFPLPAVWNSPELLASLRAYSMSRQQLSELSANHGDDDVVDDNENPASSSSEREGEASSILLLRILAAADYFTTDAALMTSVPPVDVDIILDPFLFNVLPRSLAGTACYIVAVAAVAYLVARRVSSWIGELAVSASSQQESVKKRQ
ncbi:uncharacterized protein B0T15DRAFT_239598 [Chaetomium strumarium]|uniref:Uncharacterized protein n=1 Tax=Chaetomium strumarium TaxID=1170767 RepID=A0AAJ0M0E8_9PEZI|nr:hypothetical protein B0T15DRAFT_239598 [Chaetomium strumarium]